MFTSSKNVTTPACLLSTRLTTEACLLCHNHTEGNSTYCDEADDTGLSNYLYVFIAGNMLHAVAGATINVIAPPYLDANVRTENLAVYIGQSLYL